MDEGDPFLYSTIEVPTVVGLLKNILTQYPDNGQILKELVQNAEDAGASVIEVIHDSRSKRLKNEHVQRFIEGPALLVYNNAVFSTEDWHGIRMLSESIKKDDLLKVGQFGLGFKSVFHLTDYITIISGHNVLFMDPCQPEAKMCRDLPLTQLVKVISEEQCLDLWGMYLMKEHISEGFPGTIFWFPLRRKPSKLSSTVYEQRRVENLFESFSVEAPLCLTFLKALENISLRKISDECTKFDILTVSLTGGSSLRNCQEQRRTFRSELEKCKGFPEKVLICKYDIKVKSSAESQLINQQTYKILQYLPPVEKDEKNSCMPLVGVAAPLPPVSRDSTGQIFCFLPLPIESANNTCLPVQINGYFVLDQNRRHVKWKTEESNVEKDVMWNESLVVNNIAEAYFLLLQDLQADASAKLLTSEAWYALLPNIASSTTVHVTNGRWEEMSRKVWQKLLEIPIIYSQVKEEMMYVTEVFSMSGLVALPETVVMSIKTVLQDLCIPFADIPDYVEASLQNVGAIVNLVTPSLIRNYLKKNIRVMEKNTWKKLHLLEYLLSDCQYEDLVGIPLIPRESGNWSTFSLVGNPIFICSKEYASTFVGAEDLLLCTTLDSEVTGHLREIAKGSSVLTSFSPQTHIKELLSVSVSHIQESVLSMQQLEVWLQKVWSVLHHVYLREVHQLPIIPVSEDLRPSNFITLSSAFIVRDLYCQAPKAYIEALELLEIKVLSALPTYIQHPDLQNYVIKFNHQGVTQVLERMLSLHKDVDRIIESFNARRTELQRRVFCTEIGALNLHTPVSELLKKLSLFKVVGSSTADVSLSMLNKVYPSLPEGDHFPVDSPIPLILPCNNSMLRLAINLGAQQLSKEDLCILTLQGNYTENDIHTLGWYIMNDKCVCQSEKIRSHLKSVKFVKSSSGVLCMASELYDPMDVNIKALFGECGMIPDISYLKHNDILKSLGLKQVIDLPKANLVEIVKTIPEKAFCDSDLAVKVVSCLDLINQRSDCSDICLEVENVEWIIGMPTRPSDYPNELEWTTKNGLYRPCDVKSFQLYKDIAGSVVPLVDCHSIPHVAKSFAWNQEPSIGQVIQHMQNVINVCPPSSKVPGSTYYDHMKEIYCWLSTALGSINEKSLYPLCKVPFVFTISGFKFPSEVYIPSGKEDLQLLPFMHALPFELCKNRELFCFLGAFPSQSLQLYLKVLQQVHCQHASHKQNDIVHDLQIVNSVLSKLVGRTGEIDRQQLLLPVENEGNVLEMVCVEQCAYTNQESCWLDSEELGVRIVHRTVSNRLAEALGVEPLNKHLLADEEVLEWGQHEPLTTRIHNLLRQYRDGVAVLKELVQNADDAGATKIYILYDERQNLDSHRRTITDNLKECQGPALWSYNNADFTENDFVNLCKLGGGTKELKLSKIGKFGLGFCSAYNITDVPSFVSGNDYIIFDPHQKYLEGKKCGARYNFLKERNALMLRKLTGQFQPFKGIFGFQMQETAHYKGTLFRFPLRTQRQAIESKISNCSYSNNEMIELLTMFSQIVGEVLLFTQYVQEIKVFHIGKNMSPQNMELLYESCRKERKLLMPNIDMQSPFNNCSKLVEMAVNLFDEHHRWNRRVLQELTAYDIEIKSSLLAKRLLNVDNGNWTTTWFTSWHSGTSESCLLAEKLGGKVLSLASVSVPVKVNNDSWKLVKLQNTPLGFYKAGHMHCFLPLPVKTPLSLQVNGYFEVASNRTSLVTRTVDDRLLVEDWNSVLMRDAICAAYLYLLEILKVGLNENSPYFSLWPVVPKSEDQLYVQFSKSFYGCIKDGDWKIFRNNNGWHSLSDCCFLSENFYLSNKEICGIVSEFMQVLVESRKKQVMVLPFEILREFGDELCASVISEECFYCEHFLPNLDSKCIVAEKLCKLLLRLLDSQKPYVMKMKDFACIPTSLNERLRKPSELIDPNSPVAELFDISDERFPSKSFLEGTRRETLLKLGMKTCDLSADMVMERTKTVHKIPCAKCAVMRSTNVLKYMFLKSYQVKEIANEVKLVPFLPVKPSPRNWILKWKGDQWQPNENEACSSHMNQSHGEVAFASPSSFCSPDLEEVAGSTYCVQGYLNNGKYEDYQTYVYQMLGVITHHYNLPYECIVSQLAEYGKHGEIDPVFLKRACHKIYSFLDYQAKEKKLDLSFLRNEKCLLTSSNGFVEPKLFAIRSDLVCSPALFSAEREELSHYDHMLKSMGVDYHFHAEDIYKVLLDKRNEYQSLVLNEEDINIVSNLLNLLFICKNKNDNLQLTTGELWLPDSKCVLRPVEELCIDDGVEIESKFHFLNEKVLFSQEMLKWLGIQEKKKHKLKESQCRMKFGQQEPLTTRLRNILENYPCDSGIMKELLQNADDAGATEIAFIKDNCYHPTVTLLDEKWAPLQGPALCVYNNKGFTQRDLQGIQNLGESTKLHDPVSTGQYGIGFNAVYHLTDGPSFITKGKEVPDNATLCLFDPNCLYDSHATNESPGVQFTCLEYLIEQYPDAFKAYHLEHLVEEGTMFRLPLRTTKSKLGDVVRMYSLEKLLEEFKEDMKVCLLFLKNVRKVSVCTIDINRKMSVEYSVESLISDEQKVREVRRCIEERKVISSEFNLEFFLNMQRVSYEIIVKDSNGVEYKWLLSHQFGSDKTETLSKLVLQASKENRLKLLPQAGVAILSMASKPFHNNLFRSFCYLPLHVQSGFSMCINGHFALDNSRRNLWTGSDDYKAAWNVWVMEQVLAPVIAETLNWYKTTIILPEAHSLVEYEKAARKYHKLLPACKDAKSDQWKQLACSVYNYVKAEEMALFDVIIPHSDLTRPSGFCSRAASLATSMFQNYSKPILGKLEWHTLIGVNESFPMFFHPSDQQYAILGSLKRLGMKIGHPDILQILSDANIDVCMLSPENILKFLGSSTGDYVDRCRLLVSTEVSKTPFLNVENVCQVVAYLSPIDKLETLLHKIPLLVTGESKLMFFDEENPIFICSHSRILPDSAHEFMHRQLLSEMETRNLIKESTKGIRYFTLNDFANKLPQVLGHQYKELEALIPIEGLAKFGKDWLNDVWVFIVDEVKRKYTTTPTCDWKQGKQYILDTLGIWSLYPITFKGVQYVIPIKDSCYVLGVTDTDEAFWQLPVPHPIIPESSEMAVTLKDPAAVLEVLYHWKEELASLAKGINFNAVLEYFGNHCTTYNLSVDKLRNLKIYENVVGHRCTLANKSFIVPSRELASISGLHTLGLYTNTIVLKPVIGEVKVLLEYLDPNCAKCDVAMFTHYILPHITLIPEAQYLELLEYLRDQLLKLKYKSQETWTSQEQAVVATLKQTPFINCNEKKLTAGDFYDPLHAVFILMTPNNLPEQWAKHGWHYFLILAGMVHKLTVQMFVDFARSLSSDDCKVKLKSKALVDYLCENHEELSSKWDEIICIEFLVPTKDDKLESLHPYFKTNSGLIAISKAAPSRFVKLLWTTMSILPFYARGLSKYGHIKKVPEKEFIEHICNITANVVEGRNDDIEEVMEYIYSHMVEMKNNHFLKRFADENVPVLYLPEVGKFVTVEVVVQNLEVEIVPYLYKAPTRYGKFFVLFENLGVHLEPTCDHYARVLNQIHDNCQDSSPHPEESKCMKLALKGLVKSVITLPKMSVQFLYLPTKEGKLEKSTEILVSDNNEWERVAGKGLKKPLFVGFSCLKIAMNDAHFVNQLPVHLKPTFLSEIVTEEFNLNSFDEIEVPEIEEIQCRIHSQEFVNGISRVLNHYKLVSGGTQDKLETKDIAWKLKCVQIRVLKQILTTLKVDAKVMGERKRAYHIVKMVDDNSKRLIYISQQKSGNRCTINKALTKVYTNIFDVKEVHISQDISGVVYCVLEKNDISKYLDDIDIKPFSECENETCHIYQSDVGTYMHEKFIALLDNQFCRFHDGEIATMKKYIQEEVGSDEDSLYVIVKVKCLVESGDHLMNDQYMISTTLEGDSVLVKAYQLYKFVRKTGEARSRKKYRNCRSIVTTFEQKTQLEGEEEEQEEEEIEEDSKLSEQEIRKSVRDQMKNIWRSGDAFERRHVVRRLYLRWHPDKNMDRKELCTRIAQYIQWLVTRLDNGEHVPDDDDEDNPDLQSTRKPSDFYRDAFRPPPFHFRQGAYRKGKFRGGNDSYNFYSETPRSPPFHQGTYSSGGSYSRRHSAGTKRSKKSDGPEARKWMKQSRHDYNLATNLKGESSCWIVFMCYQASEKALKAALYLEDHELANQLHKGKQSHSLSVIMSHLSLTNFQKEVEHIEKAAGPYDAMQYPTFSGPPCDLYTPEQANTILGETKELLEMISQRFLEP